MNKNSKYILAAAAVLVMFCSLAYPASAREVIKSYDVEVQIHQDSSMTVTENITAAVENIEINRGIVRVFPVRYTDSHGRIVRVGFDVLDVKIDGRRTKRNIASNGDYQELRIGDPDRMLSPGDHTFAITYKTTRQLRFFEDFDELYWNVTGNDWTFPILSASVSVALPDKDWGEGFNSIEWYSGVYGKKGTRNEAVLLPGGAVKTTRAFRPGEGLTVVYTWPKGLVAPPPPKQENAAAQTGVALMTLLLISLWLAYAWSRWGAKSSAKAVIPLFYPPYNKSPAYIGYVYKHMKLDNAVFAASIIGPAVKRAIKVEEKENKAFRTSGSSIILIKEPQTPGDLRPEEHTLMRKLFSGAKNELVVNKKNNRRLINGRSSLHEKLRPLGRLHNKNTSKLLPAAGIYLLGIIALYPFSGIYPITMIISFVAGVVLISAALAYGKIPRRAGGGFRQFIARIIPAAATGVIIWRVLHDADISINPAPSLIFIASAGVISVMRPLLMTYTQRGSDLINKIEGLRLYMNTAEKSRLEMFYPSKETPELFERLLPYALALGVAKTWADKFASILNTAQYEPAWYVGSSSDIFMNSGGIDRFSSNLQKQMAYGLSTPPSSTNSSSVSGSGGGGFSGGGGGGGGGRGW